MLDTNSQSHSHSGLSQGLNKYFHHIDRGGKLSSEITGGIAIFLLAICGVFINMQLIAKLSLSGSYADASIAQVASNGEVYASTYFKSLLIAFIGSMLIGLLARLPLVQVTSLGLSTVMISLTGVGNGLTYYNLLLISFVSAIVFTVLMAVPVVRSGIMAAIPTSIQKALPAATGLLFAYIAVQLSGIISVNGSMISIYGIGEELDVVSDQVMLSGLINISHFSYGTDQYHPLMLISFLLSLASFVIYLVYRRYTKRPYLYTVLTSTGLFLILSTLLVAVNWKNGKMSMESMWGRLWMIGSEDAMHTHIGSVIKTISIGKIFSEGMDFSAYTAEGGNVLVLMLIGVLTFLFMNLFDTKATVDATVAGCQMDLVENPIKETGSYDRTIGMTYVGQGIMNIVAPLLGAGPVAIGKESYAGAKDGAKSGIASIVAGIGFMLSMFVWLIPALLVTVTSYDIVFNMYGHHGKVMQLLAECSFGIANAVMVIVGLSMAKHGFSFDRTKTQEYVLAVTLIGATFLFSNLALGVASAMVVSVLLTVMGLKNENEKVILQMMLGLMSALLLILAFKYL